METDNTTRKKRDTSKKRHAVLEGAIRVFIENGYESSSMDRIAEEAGVSKRTVYNHFASKEILFQEIISAFLAERDERKPIQYTRDLPLKEQLRRFAQAEIFLVDDPTRRGLSKLFTSVFLTDPDLCAITRGRFSPHSELIRWLTAADKDGALRIPSPELAARLFYGMVEGCITWPATMSGGVSLNYSAPILEELLETFLLRYQPAGSRV
jgi:TetR/AcrR family transcriptional regulator, regulator of autoinduction and epiphytic fitness